VSPFVTSSKSSAWETGPRAWDTFVQRHPELGFPRGRWAFHNFLRLHRQPLVDADAIRLARNRHWVAHVDHFCRVAFDLATGHGVESQPQAPNEIGIGGGAHDQATETSWGQA
jgi:hypothetical protein